MSDVMPDDTEVLKFRLRLMRRLVPFLLNTDDTTRSRAIELIIPYEDENFFYIFQALLADSYDVVRCSAVQGLTFLKKAIPLSMSLQGAEMENNLVRPYYVFYLHKYDIMDVRNTLDRALNSNIRDKVSANASMFILNSDEFYLDQIVREMIGQGGSTDSEFTRNILLDVIYITKRMDLDCLQLEILNLVLSKYGLLSLMNE